MAFWDSEKGEIIYFHDRPSKFLGWDKIDCGCCNGIEWGGDYPKECPRCGGVGMLFRHNKSGVIAWYPGGPFCGREEKAAREEGSA